MLNRVPQVRILPGTPYLTRQYCLAKQTSPTITSAPLTSADERSLGAAQRAGG
jgi:hypothetical protein